MTFSRRPLLRMNRGRIATVAGVIVPPVGDTTPPGVTSIVAIATGITITLNEACDQTSTPAAGAFSSTGTHATFGTPSWTSATTLSIPCSDDSRITDFETVTFSYTAGANPIRDVALNNLANFSGAAVTNSSTFLAGAVLLWSAYRASNYTLSGSTVTAFTDEAGGFAYTVAGSPQYSATGLNSLPAVVFDGTDDLFSGTNAAILSALDEQAPRHFFSVARYDVDDALGTLLGTGNTGVNNNGRIQYGLANTGAGVHRAESTNDAATTTARSGVDGAPDTSPHVYEFFGSTTKTMRRDGVIDGASSGTNLNAAAWNPGTSTATGFVIGALPTAAGYARFLDGACSYALLMPSVLNDTDATEVRNYLYFLAGL